MLKSVYRYFFVPDIYYVVERDQNNVEHERRRTKRFVWRNLYRQHMQDLKAWEDLYFPVGPQFYTPIVRTFVSLRFRMKTGRPVQDLWKAYKALTDLNEGEEVLNLTQVRVLGIVCLMKAHPGHFQLRTPGYWFCINDNGPGQIYVQEIYGLSSDHKHSATETVEWKTNFREGWSCKPELSSSIFMWLNAMVSQVEDRE